MELKDKNCTIPRKDTKPLKSKEIIRLMKELLPGWRVIRDKKIRKEYPFEDFMAGIEFVNRIASLAEEENHHPDLFIHYASVEVELTTHAVGGLSENDFILAAKIDHL